MKNSDKFIIEDLFGMTYSELCQREEIAQAMESELSDVVLYAQEYGASEHVKDLLSMVIMPWEVPEHHQLNDYHLVVKLMVILPDRREYQVLSEEDKQALRRACEAIRKGL